MHHEITFIDNDHYEYQQELAELAGSVIDDYGHTSELLSTMLVCEGDMAQPRVHGCDVAQLWD